MQRNSSPLLEMDVATIDDLLFELITLEHEVKPLKKRIDEIKQWCKATGSFSTINYVCAVKELERRSLVSIEKAKDLLGMEFLEHNGLIYVSNYQVVSIVEKSDL